MSTLSKYLHPWTIRRIERTRLLTGETLAEQDILLLDRTLRELWNSAVGGANSGGRPTGTAIYPAAKLLYYASLLGPSLQGALIPEVNTNDPRDYFAESPIGRTPLGYRRAVANRLSDGQLFRSDLGCRGNSIGSPETETENFFLRTGITVNEINAVNTALGLTSGCFAFGFNLNGPPPAGASVLGFNSSGSVWAHCNVNGTLTFSLKGPAFGFDVTLTAEQSTAGSYLVSRRTSGILTVYKDGAVIGSALAGADLGAGTTGDRDIPLFCRNDADNGVPVARWTGWASDFSFWAQLTQDEELMVADVMTRHKARRGGNAT